ncbi:MAG TPA: CDP-alcohol phosphatidyltransferase family protein [Terriglobia bacterium]|nr:CDP-alcohol phosphatidyltransferase family protein [Terriglobia bacterium]
MTRSLTFQNATRQQQSILTSLEKRSLAWMAARLPDWVNSDHLTILGFAGMILTGLSYYLARWDRRMLLVGIFFLALNWFGDSLDGTLARYRNRLRPRYGFYVDHIVDAFGILCLLAGFALSGYMSLTVAMGFLIVYYLVNIEIYLATYTVGVFKLSYGIFGPTELRVLLAIGNIALMFKPFVTIVGHRFLLADVGAVVAIPVLFGFAVVGTLRNTVRLYNEERLD